MASKLALTPNASVAHYENFPVASLLLPKRYRRAVAAIYHFARTADDVADEGDTLDALRLQQLNAFGVQLDVMLQDRASEPVMPLFQVLALQVRTWSLPLSPFHDLLAAFKQDIVCKRYASFDDVSQYCALSANPVGRLMLHLYGCVSDQYFAWSDAICSGLQWVNFLQDIAVDWQKNRVYLPQDELVRFGVSEAHIANGVVDDAWRSLMAFQVERTRAMLLSGLPLVYALPGRFGWELRVIVLGGLRALSCIEHLKMDVFSQRAHLKAWDWCVLLCQAVKLSLIKPKTKGA